MNKRKFKKKTKKIQRKIYDEFLIPKSLRQELMQKIYDEQYLNFIENLIINGTSRKKPKGIFQ